MKVRDVIIIVLVVICAGLAVTVGIFARKYAPQVTETQPQSQTAQTTAKDISKVATKNITLALSEYRAYLTWQAVDGASGYYVYYDDGNGWQEYGKTKKIDFRGKDLAGGTSYLFGIKPYSLSGNKEVISEKFVYTIGGNTLPNTPQVKVNKAGDGYQLTWEAINHADEYIVYTMAQGQTEWKRETITKKTLYLIEKAPADTFFAAVRAVRYADSQKYVSDYVKIRVSAEKTEGKLYSCGDSIAIGVGSHGYSYANIFAEEHHLEMVNGAVASAQISSQNKGVDHVGQRIMQQVTDQYQYVMIEGGNNDYFFGATLGTVTADGTKEFDMNTTCGALESALTYLKEKCPKTKVIVILSHDAAERSEVKNSIGLTLADYMDAMRAICKKYGVTVADCYRESGLNTKDLSLSDMYTHHYNGVYPKGDGLHPTEEAYRKFYMPIINTAVK
ncbi:MAG: SGNH/GDSL hydrolase family protein [Clostridia bacterium]|nr:SGNH/GDSL hydrolase family protein [Clostridia bacterium]